MINLILITLLTVFVIDLSGIVDSVKYFLWKTWIKKGDYHSLHLKPFDCSLCSSWWLGLIYLFVTHQFTFPLIAFQALLSFLTPVMGDFMLWVKDTITTLINVLYTFITPRNN